MNRYGQEKENRSAVVEDIHVAGLVDIAADHRSAVRGIAP
jgi:hypothetical protein